MSEPLRFMVDELVGHGERELPASGWLQVDQERVDRFADITEERQWIHVDPERARESPFGGTIAHGYLTLALVPRLLSEVFVLEGAPAVINYGLERLRFPAPLPVGHEVRLVAKFLNAAERRNGILFRLALTVEIRDVDRPALVAEALYLATTGAV